MAAVSDLVLADFIERLSRPRYIHQLFEYAGNASANSYRIPDVALPTVVTSPTHADPTTLTPTDFDLLVNRRRQYNINVDDLQRRQILAGGYAGAISGRMFAGLMGLLEDDMWEAVRVAAWADAGANSAAGSGENILNKGLTALTTAMVVDAIGSLDGPGIEDMLWIASPVADPIIRNLYRDQMTSIPVNSPMLGVPMEGVTIHGPPLIKSHAMPKLWTVAASASAVASGVWTITVPEGHGLQVGMLITTSGGTNNIATAAEITAVTATTITVSSGSATDAANGALVVSTNATVIGLVDRAKCYYAGDAIPQTRTVQNPRYAGADALQAYASFGRLVIPGFVRLLLVPA